MHQKAHVKEAEAGRPLPDKLFYKIGEVSRLTNVEPYVLRYWESEFSFLKPRKSKSGQRVYVKKDLETILKIKSLLYSERYTIEGVRKRLGEGIRPGGAESPATSQVEAGSKLNIPQAAEELTSPAEGLASPGRRSSSPHETLEQVKKRLREILKGLS